MKTETQIQIEKLQAELDKLKVLAESEHEPKDGEWWVIKGVSKDALIIYDKNKQEYTGFNHAGNWSTYFGYPRIFKDCVCRKATDTEVLEALTKEAERRGFKKGVRFNSVIFSDNGVIGDKFYLSNDGSLMSSSNGLCIFCTQRLQWATLIEEEKIYIGENESEQKFEVGKWYLLPEYPILGLIKKVVGHEVHYFGFVNEEKKETWFHSDNDARPATNTEVLEAFTNYFRSKGFKNGSKFKSAAYEECIGEYKEPLAFFNNHICSGNTTIFDACKLTLATLIEEEKIYILGNEVKFHNLYCQIGDLRFTKEMIKTMYLCDDSYLAKILKRMEG